MPLRRYTYSLAGVCLAVESSTEEIFRHLNLVFADFEETSEATPVFTYNVVESATGFAVTPPASDALTFPNPSAAAEYVQWDMSRTALSRVDDRFALHAAAVTDPGSTGAILLAGPSGAGKSTLATELVRRGFGLLSDEAVFLSFGDLTVKGFPRAIGQISDLGFGPVKRYTPSSQLGARLVRQPMPVTALVLLASFAVKSRWVRASKTKAFRDLLSQVYPAGPVEPIVDALVKLVSRVPSFELHSGSDAADLLVNELAGSALVA